MNYWEVNLFYQVTHFAGRWPAFDRLMILFATDGIYVYPLLLLAAWFALPRPEADERHALVATVPAMLLALAINYVIGLFWFRPRPFVVLPAHSFTQLVTHAADAAFPSDHAAGSFALASAAWARAPRWISVTFTVLAVIIMVARVYVGVHWPTDVLGGMVVGILSGRLTAWASPAFRPLTNLGLRMFRYGDWVRERKTDR